MSLTIQLDPPADITVSIANGYMVVLRSDGTSVFLSDFRDKAAGVADLIARMFETLASAPDLTPEERTAVRDRMTRAVEDCTPADRRCWFCGLPAHACDHAEVPDDSPAMYEPVPYTLPPPADATADELSHFTDDAVICGGRIVDPFGNHGHCTLDRGHNSDCTNVREWRVGA